MVAQLDGSLYAYPVFSVHKYEITLLCGTTISANLYIRSTPVTLALLYIGTCFTISHPLLQE